MATTGARALDGGAHYTPGLTGGRLRNRRPSRPRRALCRRHGRFLPFADQGQRYNRRALAEAAISRYKRGIGDALRSRTDRRQATEVAVAVHALNRMLELGRPKYVRIA